MRYLIGSVIILGIVCGASLAIQLAIQLVVQLATQLAIQTQKFYGGDRIILFLYIDGFLCDGNPKNPNCSRASIIDVWASWIKNFVTPSWA